LKRYPVLRVSVHGRTICAVSRRRAFVFRNRIWPGWRHPIQAGRRRPSRAIVKKRKSKIKVRNSKIKIRSPF